MLVSHVSFANDRSLHRKTNASKPKFWEGMLGETFLDVCMSMAKFRPHTPDLSRPVPRRLQNTL